jgi:hypothetical protein
MSVRYISHVHNFASLGVKQNYLATYEGEQKMISLTG